MAENPLAPSEAHLQRIRERAYHMWESEGRPEGQAEAYWERARELDALATNLPTAPEEMLPVEEASLQENLGEFPSLMTDEGDTMPTPTTRKAAKRVRDGG